MTTDLEERLTHTLRQRAGSVSCDRWPDVSEFRARPIVVPAIPRGGERRRAVTRGRRTVWAAVAAALVVAVLGAGLATRRSATVHEPVADGTTMPPDVATAMATIQVLVHEGTLFGEVGRGTAQGSPEPATGTLHLDGKPEVLYVGAEYCPYCAAVRWALAVALSRFGAFTSLGSTTSASDDIFPDTPSFSFHGAAYESPTLAFVGVETQDRERRPLDRLTTEQQRVLNLDDPDASIPFIDIGGRFLVSGATFDPAVLRGLSMGQIAQALGDPSSPVSQAVIGAANQLTTALCSVTDNRPASACHA